MKDQASQTTEDDSPRSQPSQNEHWLEQAVSAAVEYVGSFLQTFFVLLWRPNRAAQYATDRSARPHGFLVSSLLVSGLMVETVLLYRGRSIDEDLLKAYSHAIESWGLRELFLLTIPPLFVVWGAAFLVGWLSGIERRQDDNPKVFHGFCHAVGVQLLIVALASLTYISLKAVQSNPTEDHRWTRDLVLAPLAIAIVLSGALQLQNLLLVWGKAAWTQRWWLRLPFATMVSAACILGVLRIAAETFDFRASQQTGERLSMEEWSGKARILVDILESEITVSSADQLATEQTHVQQRIALTNVTNLPHAIPCPTKLRLLGDRAAAPVIVTCESNPSDETAGWVLQPGETRIVAWTLHLPNAILRRDMTIAAFSCIEIDLQRWHRDIERPLGSPMDCLVCLRPAEWSLPTAKLALQQSLIPNSQN